jgi:recombination protein RecR
MTEYLLPLELMVEKLGTLPGVGRKTAAKYAFHLLNLPEEDLEEFCATLLSGKRRIKKCALCNNLAEEERCGICADPKRENGQICVVEDVKTLMALERAGSFKGVYHVLGGALSPVDGIGPDQIDVAGLLSRIEDGEQSFSEVILATNPTVEGETTALYVTRLLRGKNIRVTRLACGIPVGADLEYADEITLSRALEGRKDLE